MKLPEKQHKNHTNGMFLKRYRKANSPNIACALCTKFLAILPENNHDVGFDDLHCFLT